MASRLTVTSDGSRPTALQWLRSTSTLCATVSDVAEEVRHVGVAGHQLQRPLLPAAADEDRRPAGLHRARARCGPRGSGSSAPRSSAPPRGTSPGRSAAPPPAGRGARPCGREVESQALVLHVVPGRTEAEDGAPAADDVERRDDLGQMRRVAIGHAGHHGAQADARGPGRQRAEQRVRIEHRRARAAHRRQLVEVVHHPDRVEPGVLRRRCHRHHAVEEAPGASGVKLGICRPKRMRANLPGRLGRARSSPARQAPQPGQRHRALRGLERAQRRAAPAEAAAANATRGSRRSPPASTATVSRSTARALPVQGQELFGGGPALQHDRRRPGDQVEGRRADTAHAASRRTRRRSL